MDIRARYRRILVLVIVLIYVYFNSKQYSWYLKEENPCRRDEEETAELKQLAADTHIILENFHLTHFLCYGRLVLDLTICFAHSKV